MKNLTLDSFCSKEADIEINQYKILSGLKHYREEFNRNRLYPYLTDLVNLSSQLEEVFEKRAQLTAPLPKGIKNGEKEKNVFVEIIENPVEVKDYLYDLIEWALPQIKQVIEEAYVFYNFVEDNMNVHEVGAVSEFKNNGFFFVPDNAHKVLQIHRYDYYLYSFDSKPFSSIQTCFVEIEEQLKFKGEEEIIKFNLVKKYKENPNVAAYICENEYDFPFEETIFPIAKRKLLSHLDE